MTIKNKVIDMLDESIDTVTYKYSRINNTIGPVYITQSENPFKILAFILKNKTIEFSPVSYISDDIFLFLMILISLCVITVSSIIPSLGIALFCISFPDYWWVMSIQVLALLIYGIKKLKIVLTGLWFIDICIILAGKNTAKIVWNHPFSVATALICSILLFQYMDVIFH